MSVRTSDDQPVIQLVSVCRRLQNARDQLDFSYSMWVGGYRVLNRNMFLFNLYANGQMISPLECPLDNSSGQCVAFKTPSGVEHCHLNLFGNEFSYLGRRPCINL